MFFSSVPVYIKIYENKVEVTNLETERSISEESVKPFSNNRLIVADFLIAQAVLKNILKQLVNRFLFLSPSLNIVIQQKDKCEGGISPVEQRVLRHIAQRCGGKNVFVIDHCTSIPKKEALALLKSLK